RRSRSRDRAPQVPGLDLRERNLIGMPYRRVGVAPRERSGEVAMSAPAIDEARLEEFMGRMVGYMTGGAACLGIWLGDELGLYSTMTEQGSASADEIAAAAGCNPRLTREWLDGQVAAGLADYDAEGDSYSLSPEASMALADDTSPVFTARGMNVLGSMFRDFEK